jgi:hypothetical protein
MCKNEQKKIPIGEAVLDTTTEVLPEIVYCLALLKASVNLNDTDEIHHPEAK